MLQKQIFIYINVYERPVMLLSFIFSCTLETSRQIRDSMPELSKFTRARTHTHTHTIYMYIVKLICRDSLRFSQESPCLS